MREFHSDYASVTYMENDHVVLLTWKKEAHFDAYREPTSFALTLLQEHKNSNFIVDARNGFEDTKEDVDWDLPIFCQKWQRRVASSLDLL